MKKKINVFRNNLYILGMVQKASPWRIFLESLSVILSVGTNFLFNVYLIRLVLNGVQQGVSFQEILKYILVIGGILIIYYIFLNLYNEIYLPISNAAIYKSIQKKVFEKAKVVDVSCYEDAEFYDKYTKTADGTAKITNGVLSTISEWLNAFLTICTTSLVIFMIDPIFIVFTIIPAIYTMTAGKRLNRLRYERDMEILEQTRRRDYIKRTFYLADFSKELRLTDISNVLFGRFFESIAEIKAIIYKRGLKISALDYLALIIQNVILFIGTIVYATWRTVVVKTMLLGDCVIVVNNVVSTANAIRGVADGYAKMHSNALNINHIRDFFEYVPVIKEEENGADAASVNPAIVFRNVSFAYSDSERNVLNNINLEIQPGEKIALVGHNGAGKTTLVKLLLRMYDPTGGCVELDGRDIREYRLSGYRKLYATVFQHFKVFSTDIMRNVWLKDNISEEERKLAIVGMQNSGIYDKVQSLPNKENTIMTREFDEEGTAFSGGENQKIAIARVFTRPSKIVIMDEPSSALDPIAEYNMYQAMMKACEKKSVVYISHRLASAVLADKVYLLENGEIIEHGTHSELLALGGKYAKMWEMQSEQYTKGVKADA